MRHVRFRVWPILGVVVVILAAGAAHAGNEPDVDKLNQKIDPLSLRDLDGKALSLREAGESRATVVVFLSFDCPVSNSYVPVLAELAKTYGPRGVGFRAVLGGEDTDAATLGKLAAEFKIPFPVLRDEGNRAADALKAEITPEAFVLDHNGVLRYRGRIDDGYSARLKKNARVTRSDLKQALDDLLAGRPVAEPATRAVGCPLRGGRGAARSGPVTFYRDVLPILQNHCQQCHRPGEVGPFSLMTFKQAVNWAADVKDYTQARKMPPWKPVEGLPFHNERKLSDKDLATLAAWADGGTPEGDSGDAPSPRRFTEGWQLGTPDLVLTVPEEMTVGPSGPDLFRCFVLPTNLDEDRFVVAIEVRPSNKRVVHHTLNFLDRTGQGRKMEKDEKERAKKADEADHGPGYSVAMGIGFLPQGGLGGWAPGQMARVLPDGVGYFVPKGSDLVMQVHYHRTGRVEKDRTSVGLYFARTNDLKPFKNITLPGRFLFIPAGDDHHRVRGEVEVVTDCTLYTVMPHMHMLGKEIKVTLTPPGAPARTLVAIRDWDYNWQETYLLKEPVHLKPGTRLEVEAVYDNSDRNPSNPFTPPREVIFGEQTTNEMCFVFLGATSEQKGRIQVKRPGLRAPDVNKP